MGSYRSTLQAGLETATVSSPSEVATDETSANVIKVTLISTAPFLTRLHSACTNRIKHHRDQLKTVKTHQNQ